MTASGIGSDLRIIGDLHELTGFWTRIRHVRGVNRRVLAGWLLNPTIRNRAFSDNMDKARAERPSAEGRGGRFQTTRKTITGRIRTNDQLAITQVSS